MTKPFAEYPFPWAIDPGGLMYSGAKLYIYEAGSSSLAVIYSDSDGTTTTNPMTSDSAGRFAAYWLDPGEYDFKLFAPGTAPPGDSPIRTALNVTVAALILNALAVANNAELAALSPSQRAETAIYHTRARDSAAGIGGGQWIWESADRSADVTADPGEFIFIAPDGEDGSDGAFLRLFDGPVHSLWGCAGDGTTDDTTALNRFFGLAASYPLHIDAGTYKFTSALTVIAASNIAITGDGETAALRYTGASTSPGNLLSIGDGVSTFDDIGVRGFTISSATTLVAGDALRVTSCTDVHIDLILGSESEYTLYNGVRLDAVTLCWLHETRSYVQAAKFAANDCIEMYLMHAFARGTLSAGEGTGYGVHLGGGCGGIYLHNGLIIQNDIGVLVDTTLARTTVVVGDTHSNTTIDSLTSTAALTAGMAVTGSGISVGTYIVSIDSETAITINQNATATASDVSLTFFNGNTQIFFGGAVIDVNKNAALYLNDTTGNLLSKRVCLDNAWLTSCTTGSGLVVNEWAGGHISSPGATILNNTGRGIGILDQTVRIDIGAATTIANNDLDGVYSDANITIVCDAVPHSNGGLAFSQTVARETAAHIISDVTIANGANAVIRNVSTISADDWEGLFEVSNGTLCALYLLSAGGSTEISDPGTAYRPGTTPSSDTSIGWDGSNWRLYNGSGGELTYRCIMHKGRSY